VPDHGRRLVWDAGLEGPRLLLTHSVIQAIEMHLPLQVNMQMYENVIYVAGHILPVGRLGLTAIAPRSVTGPGFYRTDADAHVDVMSALRELRLNLVAQVHCHPGSAVSHSGLDDSEAIVRAEGHWSIVVPYYGRCGILPLTKCGVHCFTHGTFLRLRRPAIMKRVSIVPDWVDLREVRHGRA
jgi:hypothetical protein